MCVVYVQYYAGGLSDDLHNLTFTNTNGNWFDLDKFVVSTWPTLPTNVSTSQVPFPCSSNTTDVLKATASNAVDTNQRYIFYLLIDPYS